ncbi:MAG: DUF5682 family protein [Chloroflexota bacterium]
MTAGQVHVFGIRHHGPGSARNLQAALNDLQPDVVLIEGPPDADALLALASQPEMEPPVALLIYDPTSPKRGVFYPFAVFSPEWQAIRFAHQQQTPVRFIDLPQAYQFALSEAEEEEDEQAPTDDSIERDPLGTIAQAAGYDDGEAWWEQMVEQRQDSAQIFEAILLAMAALRQESEAESSLLTLQREAYMRQQIRQAQRDGFTRIAVVCGAWHAPVLIPEAMPAIKTDKAQLKGLKKYKVSATWIPWTYDRLTKYSGYGAGVQSPGWYQHLWQHPENPAPQWLTQVAHLFRAESLDASPAQVIDAVHFANTLAAIRNRACPSLDELNEAALATFCHGYQTPMQLIHDKLIVSNRLGQVPTETPAVPLQNDFAQEQKRLRLKAEASERILKLDLRKPLHLGRSHLLHRLTLLEIDWGQNESVANQRGTFNEPWRLRWYPELALRLIEKNVWGNTIEEATAAYARHQSDTAPDLAHLTQLIYQILLTDLPETLVYVVHKLEAVAAITHDISDLMASFPALADVLVYGDVRKTDVSMLDTLINGIVTRVCIGLPLACASLADDAARELLEHLIRFQQAIRLVDQADYATMWYDVLAQVCQQTGANGLIRGRSARILFDDQQVEIDTVINWMRLALSPANELTDVAVWLTGFLKDSGLVLLHNTRLLKVINDWVITLSEADFVALLPLLRRIFATFATPERRQIGQLISRQQQGQSAPRAVAKNDDFVPVDQARADSVLPILAELLGVPSPLEANLDRNKS